MFWCNCYCWPVQEPCHIVCMRARHAKHRRVLQRAYCDCADPVGACSFSMLLAGSRGRHGALQEPPLWLRAPTGRCFASGRGTSCSRLVPSQLERVTRSAYSLASALCHTASMAWSRACCTLQWGRGGPAAAFLAGATAGDRRAVHAPKRAAGPTSSPPAPQEEGRTAGKRGLSS